MTVIFPAFNCFEIRQVFPLAAYWKDLWGFRLILSSWAGFTLAPDFIQDVLREPLKIHFGEQANLFVVKIHFGEQANLFVAGLPQTKVTLSTDKADLSSLPDNKNSLLVAQKQLLELPLIYQIQSFTS